MKTLWSPRALLPDGWATDVTVTIGADGRIASVQAGTQPSGERVGLLLPAPVNAHSHAFQRAMAGLTETRGPDPRDTFWTWRRLMYRFLDRLTPDHVQAIAELVFMEMLEAGYGAVAEFHYLHHDIGGVPYATLPEMAQRITTAAQGAGLGLTLLPVFYMQGGCDGRALQGGQRRFGCDPDLFARLHSDSAAIIAQGPEDFGIGIAPHSLRAVTPEALNNLRDICPTGPVHMHLAEQVAEVEEVKAHHGA